MRSETETEIDFCLQSQKLKVCHLLIIGANLACFFLYFWTETVFILIFFAFLALKKCQINIGSPKFGHINLNSSDVFTNLFHEYVFSNIFLSLSSWRRRKFLICPKHFFFSVCQLKKKS